MCVYVKQHHSIPAIKLPNIHICDWLRINNNKKRRKKENKKLNRWLQYITRMVNTHTHTHIMWIASVIIITTIEWIAFKNQAFRSAKSLIEMSAHQNEKPHGNEEWYHHKTILWMIFALLPFGKPKQLTNWWADKNYGKPEKFITYKWSENVMQKDVASNCESSLGQWKRT